MESVPFILAGAALQHLPLRMNARALPYLGCGCGPGPAARSIPATAAAWLLFGPLVAVARFGAALLIDRAQRTASPCEHERDSTLAQLFAIAPLAGIGAACALFLPTILGTHASAGAAFAGGAIFAFAMAPCGIGAAGLASAIRGVMPAAAFGFLCVAGICDVRTWLRTKRAHAHAQHDALAYALAAVACALVAARGGGGLLHPKLALLLWPCAGGCMLFALRYRQSACGNLRIAPAIMLAGAVLAAPPPEYHATETTIADAFAGERVDFTGRVTHTGDATTLVRYAITCCRADAAPVVIRLERNERMNGWAHARGVLVEAPGGLRLRTQSLVAVAAPADPFVYR